MCTTTSTGNCPTETSYLWNCFSNETLSEIQNKRREYQTLSLKLETPCSWHIKNQCYRILQLPLQLVKVVFLRFLNLLRPLIKFAHPKQLIMKLEGSGLDTEFLCHSFWISQVSNSDVFLTLTCWAFTVITETVATEAQYFTFFLLSF